MDIAAWLKGLGLERYAGAFDDAEIDADALKLIDDDDLKEIGLPLGPRRKVLAALSSGEAPEAVASTVATAGPERRHLTVMFADLADSTGLSVRVDPEILSEVLRAFKELATAEVVHGGGVVAKYLGDGVLAYFGWPQAREDAAECAVRCALAILERVKAVQGPVGETIACRIGVATGLVVVGGVTGSGAAREDTIAGEVLNLAARLEALALPGEIALAESTQRLVGQLFDCEPLGSHELKGFAQPIQAWRAVREAAHTNRFAAGRVARAPLIGREQELSMMISRWEKAATGEGRAILLLGEAGMGKSRLAQEVHGHIVNGPHGFVSWQCSAFHSGKSLYPVIEQLTSAAEITDGDAPDVRLGKLAALLSPVGAPAGEMLPLFADLLGVPPEAGYAAPDLLPTQRRMATIAALAEWLSCIAQTKPLLLLLEDAHWIDATTLDLINRIVASIDHAPIFALVTSRPGFVPSWAGGATVGVIGLDRLGNADCDVLVRRLAAETAAPDAMIRQVISNSDGNPLFLEELSRAVFDRRLTGPNIVPDSLQSSLMARLDQLGEAKTVAQTCSVLGRRFATPLLGRVVDLHPDVLERQLAILVANDILYPLGRAQDARFEFKHALVRDAAYGSLLLSRRRELHELCGRTLERDFPDVAKTEPELLAHHFAEAGLAGAASDHAERAGDRAAASVSFAEAIAGYGDALEQNGRTPATGERDARELALLLKLGPAQVIIDGAQSTAVRDTYVRAEALARSLGDEDRRFQSVWGLWFNANIGRDLDVAADRAQELIQLSSRSGDDAHQLEALHCRWSSALFRGEYAKAVTDAERGAQLYTTERHHALHVNFGGHDPGVCASCCWGSALSAQGRFRASATLITEGLALADALGHPHSIGHALMNGCVAAAMARDLEALRAQGERLLALASKHNFPPVRALAAYLLRWADSEGGSTAGLEAMRAGFPHTSAIAPFPLLFAGLLADQLLRRGETDTALGVTDVALRAVRPPDVGLYLSEVHRLRGAGLVALGDRAAAGEQFARAREVARRQSSALFEARALASALQLVGGGEERLSLEAALRDALAHVDRGAAWPDHAEAAALLA